MDSELQISVVMATYNRVETLSETIRHLAEQDLDPRKFEVIIVDDGSPDSTGEMVAGAMKTVPFKLTYLHHANRGPGYTQNRGIRAARAPVVLLIADDIFLAPGALRHHLAVHTAHPEESVAVLGRVIQSPKATQSVFLKVWDPFRFRDLGDAVTLPYYMFWACNVSFKREFMIRHGMFREHKGRAGYAAHEDVEVGYRLHQHGLKLLYSREALGEHYHITTLESEMKRAYSRGLNWDEFKGFAPAPELTVKYHVLNRYTLGEHARALFGPGRRYLMGTDRNPVLLALKYLAIFTAFNALTVHFVWLPILNRAETDPRVARFMHRILYRGVISYHFYKGCREARRIYGPPSRPPHTVNA